MKHIWIVIFLLLGVWSCRDPKGPDLIEEPFEPTFVELEIPYLFPIMDIPADNPLTKEGIELGRELFYEPMLSGDDSQSCASCHLAEASFTDPDKLSKGIDGLLGTRNAMPIINVGWMKKFFWDGRVTGLEGQAIFPVEDPIEMHADWDNVIQKLQASEQYQTLFRKAFKVKGVSKERAVKAIAQFERTLISANSKTDKVLAPGSGIFYTDQEQAGRDLFFSERADCFHCHGSILFTDSKFHNNGLDENHEADFGLFKVTQNPADKGKFKTPTLRNLKFTAPYMHDGRFQTLDEVLEFYSEQVQVSASLDPLMSHNGGIEMTATERADLKAYLLTLTDASFINNKDFWDPN